MHANIPDAYSFFTISTLNLNVVSTNLQERFESLVDWLEVINPDVLMVQEVREGTTEEWLLGLVGEGKPFKYMFSPGSEVSDCAILTRMPIKEAGIIQLPIARKDWIAPSRAVWVQADSPNGHDSFFVSTHLAWGPFNEHMRTEQLQTIEHWAAQKAGDSSKHTLPKVYLGGDFNAEPQNLCIRWLRGEEILSAEEGYQSTRWTDCWEEAKFGRVGGEQSGVTSSGRNLYAQETARGYARIPYPELLPERRIDYLFTRGYAYGSQGTPLQSGVWAYGAEYDPVTALGAVSDHYGVWAKVLDIPS